MDSFDPIVNRNLDFDPPTIVDDRGSKRSFDPLAGESDELTDEQILADLADLLGTVTKQAVNRDRQSSPRYQAARKLVAKGVAVFPCQPGGKAPAVAGGFKSASADPAQIDVWWQEADYNLAVRPVSFGCVAIDLDLYKPGGVDPAFIASLPPTKTITTPRGGQHRLYKTDEPWGNSRGGLPRNVDVRCGNGYILLPPSVVDGKAYRFADNRAPGPLPDAIGAALRAASVPKEKVAAPDGLIENDDDAELVAEARAIIAAHIKKNGIGDDPRGDRAYGLANLLRDKRNGDNILSVEKIIELMQDAGYGDIADDIIDRRQRGDSGIEQIHPFEIPEPEGDFLEKFGKLARMEMFKISRNPAMLRLEDVINYEDGPDTEFDEMLGAIRRPILAGSDEGKKLLEKMIADLGGVAPEPKEKTGRRLHFTNGSTSTARKIEWIWNGWLALGKLHLIAGDKGAGKSTICFAMTGPITTGGQWPDGTPAPVGDAAIWSAEDDWEDTILPRCIAAGADRQRLWHIDAVTDAVSGEPRGFDPGHDIPLLEDLIAAAPQIKLLIVDPIVMAVSGDSHKNAETRRGLQPLVNFAERHNIALIGITHFTKGTDGKSPVERVTGSLAFAAFARVVLAAAASEDGSNRRLVRVASNIGPSGDGHEYRLLQEPLAGHDFSAQRIMWGGQLYGNARELLEHGRNAGARDKAAEWLLTMLANGPVDMRELKAAGEANGHSWRSIERAKVELQKQGREIKPHRRSELHWGKNPPWCWEMIARETGDLSSH